MKKTKTPGLVTLAVFTTITIFVWIFFDIYRILKKPVNVNVDPKILQTFSPSLDSNALDKIKERKYFEITSLNTQSSGVNITKPENVSTESGKETVIPGLIE
jgi:hypothetical protein